MHDEDEPVKDPVVKEDDWVEPDDSILLTEEELDAVVEETEDEEIPELTR